MKAVQCMPRAAVGQDDLTQKIWFKMVQKMIAGKPIWPAYHMLASRYKWQYFHIHWLFRICVCVTNQRCYMDGQKHAPFFRMLRATGKL